MIKNQKILITGGGGFIGSWLCENLVNHNEITVFDNGRRNAFQYLPKEKQKAVKNISGDILDKAQVKKNIQKQDIILHLAAIAGASSYEKNPTLVLQVNLGGTINLLEESLNTNIKKIILFSSSEVYGSYAKNVTEADVTTIGPAFESRWSYAVSKLTSDHYALSLFKNHQLPVTSVRPFNVYGPRQVGEGAISNMLKNAIENKPVTVTGKGTQLRSWCYISDFINAINLILQTDCSGDIFNIGNPREYFSIKQLSEKIHQLTGAKISYSPAVKSEIIERLPDIKKAEKTLGFKPKISLDEGLKLTYNWFKEIQLNQF